MSVYQHRTGLSAKISQHSSGCRNFHSSRPNAGLPVLAALFKTSSALGFTQIVGRVAMTLLPITMMKQFMAKKLLRRVDKHPESADRASRMLKQARVVSFLVLLLPAVLLSITITASLERTPLTGRMRIILLSPEEEDSIAQQLAGIGWYNAVAEILAQTSPDGHVPRVIPHNDWRTQWVLATMRKLEAAIPLLQTESSIDYSFFPSDIPIPPPAEYPLIPRPRASQLIHSWPAGTDASQHSLPHSVLGPPYSLLVVDRPESSNAFSYGFGPGGGGGVVVFSGFLNEILGPLPPPVPSSQKEFSIWTFLTGGFFKPNVPTPNQESPTEKQTSQLAVLLAHELSHLILSHHLETLSSGTIFLPTLASMISDLLRALLFPVTMILGPFVNDGISELGKIGLGEFAKAGDSCASRTMEVEADIVSTKLLAYAGYDPRSAIEFWESRQVLQLDCDPSAASSSQQSHQESPTILSMLGLDKSGTKTHPLGNERVMRLRQELERWESENARVSERQKLR